jgi:hypothetical protein
MLIGMDCLVQEVHVTQDVSVLEFDGRLWKSSVVGFRRCVEIINYSLFFKKIYRCSPSSGLAEGQPTIFWNLPEEVFLHEKT